MTKKRYSINIFLTGFMGYLVGTVGYTLIGGEKELLYYLSGLLVASFLSLIYYFYSRKRHEKLLNELERERKDERGQIIAGKSSSYTLMLTMVLCISIYVFSVVKGYEIISIMIGVSYIITMIFHSLIHSYLERTS